jgi:xanthine dehydrogenase molybdenum-binding subunit
MPEGQVLRVYTQGQGVFDDRRQIASFLGVPESEIFVALVTNGGAFGGKEDMSIQAQTALLAKVTGSPVKLALSREESLRLHPKRHPIKMTYTVGCDAEGRLTAVKADMIGDKGAYASVGSKVLERPGPAPGHAVENVRGFSRGVPNNPPCGALRVRRDQAHSPSTRWSIFWPRAGIDGWEIRYRNARDVGGTICPGQQMQTGVGLKNTLEAVKDIYKSAKYAGIACGIKNVGIGNGMPEYGRAMLEVRDDGTVGIYTGFTEMGQGLFTVLQQTACEETGLLPGVFNFVSADTKYALDCGQTTGSRGTFLGCRGVQEAARKLRADLMRRRHCKIWRASLLARCIDDTVSLESKVDKPKTFAYGYATQVVILDDDGRVESRSGAMSVRY